MNVGPKNVYRLCKRCCCRYERPDVMELTRVMTAGFGIYGKAVSERRASSPTIDIHKQRPLDVLAFLGHDQFVIDDHAFEIELQAPSLAGTVNDAHAGPESNVDIVFDSPVHDVGPRTSALSACDL